MAPPVVETSPLVYARLAGFLCLVLVIVAPFGMMYVPSLIIVPGDAAATAGKFMASESMFRLGMLSETVIFLTEIVMVVLLYVLFKPVSKTLSLMAAFARLSMTVMQGVNLLNSFAVLLLLSGAGYLAAFEPEQLHALALLFLEVHEYGAYVWQVFFGLHCLLLGYLIFKSGYFPRTLGVLMAIAALGYLTNGLGNFMFPDHKQMLASVVALTSIVGEVPFFLWLLFKGVNVQKWHDRVSAVRSPSLAAVLQPADVVAQPR